MPPPIHGEIVRIVCLHTADSNIAVFEAAARTLGFDALDLQHVVRPDLLIAAEQAGKLTDAVVAQTRAALVALSDDADAVLLTCSTLGPAVDDTPGTQIAQPPILRADAALAKYAVEAGGHVVVLCAAPTTLGPTSRLFADTIARHAATAAVAPQATVDVQLLDGAWALFKAGDTETYLSSIAAAANAAYANGADVVVLAQASMADAAQRVTGGKKPLTAPATGLAAAVHAATRSA
jgi:hypothetical protein